MVPSPPVMKVVGVFVRFHCASPSPVSKAAFSFSLYFSIFLSLAQPPGYGSNSFAGSSRILSAIVEAEVFL
jgi:hypothetical protein